MAAMVAKVARPLYGVTVVASPAKPDRPAAFLIAILKDPMRFPFQTNAGLDIG
ncbi:hypothetical protein L6R50_09510 [Myxococcota bacterium]|nr:hypothetical protein [Myxococcota bacterium]